MKRLKTRQTAALADNRLAALPPRFRGWFESRGWSPFPFQLEAWAAYLAGESGLVHAPTGMGKTLSVWGGPLVEWLLANPEATAEDQAPPLTVLWLTPLRALAKDTAENLRAPIADMGLPWTVGVRSGDTSTAIRAKQRERMPTCLITTPESLSLLLSYADNADKFRHLRCVVVDEWHELMSTKRGVQVELALARLRQQVTGLRTWGLSATLGNLPQARDVLLGTSSERGRLITAADDKRIEVETVLPPDMERFPWAGHIGTKCVSKVLKVLEDAKSTLLFTNTRSQAEIWFQALIKARPEWIGQIALHHGSLDRDLRETVEEMLRSGTVRCVVCTSSLDLGVDFPEVDQVIQVGSPKGVGRMLQRAGRSGHQPGGVSRIVCVPTHAFELVEFAAARKAAQARAIESRPPVERPLDVLVQHLVTIACGSGFTADEMLAEVRTTHAFRGLTDQEWGWCLDFVTRGGPALRAYPQYAKVVESAGRYAVTDPRIARLHRMTIGTITSTTAMQVRLMSGGYLGSIEEDFIARLRPGDRFVFAGRTLELAMVRMMTAYVKKVPKGSGMIPRWMGARFPMSTSMAEAVRRELEAFEPFPVSEGTRSEDSAATKEGEQIEMRVVRPILQIQARWSIIPTASELLIESTTDRDGHYQFLFPFEGRLVHEGLGTLLAYRLGKREPRSTVISVNDYGFQLLSPQPFELDETAWREVLSTDNLIEDLLGCLNTTEMARRQFREIARVAGLIFPGFPGSNKSVRQLQASSELFFDVLVEFDPGNLLIDQARREVLERELEVVRLRRALERFANLKLVLRETRRFTPLAFPLWAEFMRGQVTSERWIDRVQRMAVELEEAAESEVHGRTNRAQSRVYG